MMKVMDVVKIASSHPEVRAIRLDSMAFAELVTEYAMLARSPSAADLCRKSLWINGIFVFYQTGGALPIDGEHITAGAVIEGPK
jgi:hypothetical protein